ncbi:MAG: hypothetical protein JWO73_593 [Candidatus Taylorbacteria bacterium]|nr:hypothetical protein [Candidatus Taylorbacteria bacterium]
MKKISVIQWLALFYALNFLFIVALSHWPGFTDAQGRLLGLFYIDPIDDVFHLLSGLLAVVVAFKSHKWSVNYFKWVGIPYGIDAITGLFFSREFLNGDVFVHGLGGVDFSMRALEVNLPHILIVATMLWIGFWLAKRVKDPKQAQQA